MTTYYDFHLNNTPSVIDDYELQKQPFRNNLKESEIF